MIIDSLANFSINWTEGNYRPESKIKTGTKQGKKSNQNNESERTRRRHLTAVTHTSLSLNPWTLSTNHNLCLECIAAPGMCVSLLILDAEYINWSRIILCLMRRNHLKFTPKYMQAHRSELVLHEGAAGYSSSLQVPWHYWPSS